MSNTSIKLNKSICSELIEKYLDMTRDEEIKFMSEAINGKPHYSDREIAFRLSAMAIQIQKTKSINTNE